MRIFAKIEDLTGVGNYWLTLGESYHLLGQFDKAINSRLRAIELYREHGNPTDEADSLILLGETYVAAGRRDHARAAFHEGLRIYQDLGLPRAAEITVG